MKTSKKEHKFESVFKKISGFVHMNILRLLTLFKYVDFQNSAAFPNLFTFMLCKQQLKLQENNISVQKNMNCKKMQAYILLSYLFGNFASFSE